ncbi:MAG: DEAD/DEAH box helicase, partial [Anaeroplasmataceae bacterium]|nr:DEAD/DEAH box helicase [Anaeroplasmataceae bacterium]
FYIYYNVSLLDYKIEGEQLTAEEIQAMLSAYKNKKRFVKLENDVILEVKEEDVKDLDNFLEDFNLIQEGLKQPISKPINYLLKLVDEQDDFVHYDEKIYQMIKEVQNFSKSDELPDEKFLKVLRPYQIEAFKWINMLAKFGFGGILADDMGLGKTLEILSFIAKDSAEAPSLIVCPMSLVYNWENECKKWELTCPIELLIGNAIEREQLIQNINYHKKAIFITSYDSLRRDIDLYEETFRCVVADEAQYIKNQNALKSAAIKQLKADLRFALTGTPIENGLADLWSIFDYLMPGYLSNYHHFKTRYESLIMEDDVETLSLLKKRVQPFILRRTKKDVLTELPEKIEEVYYCKMDDKQEELYQLYVQKIRNDLEEEGNNILALLTRLRQICISPQLIYDEPMSSSKLNMALELIKRAISANHRILLFSQFASVFPIIGQMLEAEGISYFTLDGKTSSQRRIELVDQFNTDSQIKVFLISLKAGGTGLNLVGADMVIHLDPWWNISAQNQATDRAHRIGQTRNVHVLKLVCMNSIEEKVMLLQNLKNELADQILLSQEQKIKLTKDDILDLIS